MRRVFVNSGDYYYRLVPAWTFFFYIFLLWTGFLLYREWKKLGGDENYRPPIKDKFTTFNPAPSPKPAKP